LKDIAEDDDMHTDFVDPEPLVRGSDETWEMPLYILNIVELRSQWVVDIYDNDFPIRLSLIKQSHDTENLDLFDLSNIPKLFANLTHVERVVVAVSLCLSMHLSRVFPGLIHVNQYSVDKPPKRQQGKLSHLRECTVVPDIAMMRETIANKPEPATFDVLFDRIEGLFF
jgi:hypothetical protein